MACLDLTRFGSHFKNFSGRYPSFRATCPACGSRERGAPVRDLAIRREHDRWLLHCHRKCSTEDVVRAAGLQMADLFDRDQRVVADPIAALEEELVELEDDVELDVEPDDDVELDEEEDKATPPGGGLTLPEYAQAKQLPEAMLRKAFRLETVTLRGHGKAVRFPYADASGREVAVRHRIALTGPDRFRWRSGDHPCLYGLPQRAALGDTDALYLVEGESDTQTLHHHGIPALGLPGASMWKEERDAPHFEGVETIYVIREPGRGGDDLLDSLAPSAIASRVKVVAIEGAKDASELHLQGPDRFADRLQEATAAARPLAAVIAERRQARRQAAWERCRALAELPDVLAAVDDKLGELGLVGERQAARIIFLAVTSRLFERPVSIAVKGLSSGGKSFTVEATLKLFPPAAFYALTAMSERALAYDNEPLKHRVLVLYEAAGMESDFTSYLIRSLLSEGCIKYKTLQSTPQGIKPVTITREGPTGLIVTTTRHALHPENETRLLSLSVSDQPEQTQAILAQLAQEAMAAGSRAVHNLADWHALQDWLANGSVEVVVPFARRLAMQIPPAAVRLRRDFSTLIALIRAHALIHQQTRERDDAGRIIADISDYAAVRELVHDLMSENLATAVPDKVRETVQAVADLLHERGVDVDDVDDPLDVLKPTIGLAALEKHLKLDRATVWRRVREAERLGFLKDTRLRKGQPAQITLGDAMPQDLVLLPHPERVRSLVRAKLKLA